MPGLKGWETLISVLLRNASFIFTLECQLGMLKCNLLNQPNLIPSGENCLDNRTTWKSSSIMEHSKHFVGSFSLSILYPAPPPSRPPSMTPGHMSRHCPNQHIRLLHASFPPPRNLSSVKLIVVYRDEIRAVICTAETKIRLKCAPPLKTIRSWWLHGGRLRPPGPLPYFYMLVTPNLSHNPPAAL